MRTIDRTGAPNRIARSLRLSPDIDAQLVEAARANGTSFTTEAEHCVRLGVERRMLTPEILRLAFGEGAAGLLFLIGGAMRGAGGSRMHRARTKQRQDESGRPPWWADPDGYDAAVAAAIRVLEEFRPEGERTVDRDDPQSTGEERYVIGRVAIVVEDGPCPLGERSFVETARALLGPGLIAQSRWLKARLAEDAANAAGRAQSGTSEPISPAIRAAVVAPSAADPLPTSPPQISSPPPSVPVPAHLFFAAWMLSRAMLLGKTGAEPDEAAIAEQLANDGTLRFIANLHQGPVTARSVVEYYHWLLEHDLGPPPAQPDAAPAAPPPSPPRSAKRRRSARDAVPGGQ